MTLQVFSWASRCCRPVAPSTTNSLGSTMQQKVGTKKLISVTLSCLSLMALLYYVRYTGDTSFLVFQSDNNNSVMHLSKGSYIASPNQPVHPWPDDPNCKDFIVQVVISLHTAWKIVSQLFTTMQWKFAKMHSLPTWALTSFPGSGVTWTRQLIEGVTGYVSNFKGNLKIITDVQFIQV